MSYIGTQPIPKVSRIRTYGSLGSATNTISIPGGFTPGNIEVFIDGFYVQPTDYDESNGFDLVFIQQLDAGTEYIVVEARAFEVSGFPTLQGGSQANFTTMPQVGGDPIVESGSNADGEWTRFADGTQHLTGSTSLISGDGTLQNRVVTFANPFIATPSIQVTWQIASNVHYDATYQGVDTTTVTVFTNPASSATGYVKVAAYGRWK